MGLLLGRRCALLRLAGAGTGGGVANHSGRQREWHKGYERDAQTASGAATPSTPRTAAAQALMRGLVASATGDSTVIADLYTDDVRGWSPAVRISSAAELAIEFEDRDEAFSDIELDLTPLDVGGDKACVEWVMTATHSGPIVVDDEVCIEPTDSRLTLHGITVAEFEGDRIRSFRQYWDEAELFEQIGVLSDD